MQFIKPSEISSKIMTLIEESDKFVLIVSPYVKISKWYKLIKKIENVQNRNIHVDFIIRDDKTNQASFEELNELGLNFTSIKDLHCKLYLNEKYAIISSMNLLLSSEINSIELAYQTETESEFEELKDFCKRYLLYDFSKLENTIRIKDWRDYLSELLDDKIGRKINGNQDDETFRINTGINNYYASIWNLRKNYLKISGILTAREYIYLTRNKRNIPTINNINIELKEGEKGKYDTILGTLKIPLISKDLDYITNNEQTIIAQTICDFLLEIDEFKMWARNNRDQLD